MIIYFFFCDLVLWSIAISLWHYLFFLSSFLVLLLPGSFFLSHVGFFF